MIGYFAGLRPLVELGGWAIVGLASAWASKYLFATVRPLSEYDHIGFQILGGLVVYFLVHRTVRAVLPRVRKSRFWYQLSPWKHQLNNWVRSINFPNWVSLRRLGESNAVKLTAFAPVLGSLILLSDGVSSFLQSSLLDHGIAPTFTPMFGFIPIPRLHMIYLGLSLMGIGAIVFGLLCPDVIKRYPSAEAWLQGEDRFLAGGRLRGEFQEIIKTYWKNTAEEGLTTEHDYDRTRRLGYSESRYSQIHLLLDEIVEQNDPSFDTAEELPVQPAGRILGPDGLPAVPAPFEYEPRSEPDEWFHRFRRGPRGYVYTDAWVYVLYMGFPVERALWEPLYATAVTSFKERIVHIRFQDLAYDRSAARAFVTVIYGLGIFALAIPTLHTFVAIIKSAFR